MPVSFYDNHSCGNGPRGGKRLNAFKTFKSSLVFNDSLRYARALLKRRKGFRPSADNAAMPEVPFAQQHIQLMESNTMPSQQSPGHVGTDSMRHLIRLNHLVHLFSPAMKRSKIGQLRNPNPLMHTRL